MILAQITADPSTLEVTNAKVEPPADTFHSTLKLVEAVKELEKELKDGEYDYFRVVAELLKDVQEQMTHFLPFVATPHIALILRKIQAIESELRRQIQWCFREIGALTSSERYEHEIGSVSWSVDISPLEDVSEVIDVLGDKFRNDLLERFAQLQLIPYEKLFKINTKYAGLEHLDQRYAWFRYLLHLVEEKLGGLFPERYAIGYHLFLDFQRRTKNHLSEVLAAAEKDAHPATDDATAKVADLIKAIKSVMAFETEILTRFGIPEDGRTMSIRDAFDPHLGAYVQLEKQGLEDLMVTVMREEEAVNATITHPTLTSPGAGVAGAPAGAKQPLPPAEPFDSANRLFEYIKASLKRCMVFSTGITLLSLSKEFRLALQQYAEALKFRCPSPALPSKGKTPAVYVLESRNMEGNLARIMTTCEYCVDIVPTLENLMRSKIQPAFADQIDFSPQVGAFNDSMAFTMEILCLGEVNRCEGDFTKMREVNWGSYDTVGDSPEYIKHMLKVLADGIQRIRNYVSPSYFLNVCMKLTGTFLDAFLQCIYSLRRISKTGGGQLLLDLSTIKEFLLTMPNARTPTGKTPIDISSVYVRVIGQKCQKVEVVLKLICVEDALFEDIAKELWKDAPKEDLEAIQGLKGNRSILKEVAIPFDNVGDALKNGATKMHQGTKEGLNKSVGKFSEGVMAVGKGMFGDLMSGNLFSDMSTHSNEAGSSHGAHTSTTHGPPAQSNGSKGLGKAVASVTGAMAFTKKAPPPGPAAAPGANGSAGRGAPANRK